VLLETFEKQFHLPAVAIQIGCGQGGDDKIVGQEVEGVAGLMIVVFDAPEWLRIVGGGVDAGEHNGLVASQARGLVDRM